MGLKTEKLPMSSLGRWPAARILESCNYNDDDDDDDDDDNNNNNYINNYNYI